jgi:osmotically-inducible protein OsmY
MLSTLLAIENTRMANNLNITPMNNDKELLKQIQERLENDTRFANCLESIYVLINNGVVILAGSVDDPSLKMPAERTVSCIPGVSLVIDDLKVEPNENRAVRVQIDWAKSNLSLSH